MKLYTIAESLRFSDEPWNSKKLGNICKITMGQSPSSSNYTENETDTVLIQGNADLINGKVVPRIYTTEVTKIANPGDIILTVRAPVGDLAINEFKSCIGRGVCSIEGNKFIYYFLQTLKDKHLWERFSQGSTFESINSNDIKNLNVKIPSEKTQKLISDFLTLIDNKISLLEKKYDNYQNFKKYLMQQIFAQKLRFDKSNKSQNEIQLDNVITIINKRNKDDQNLPVLSISNRLGFISQNEQFEDREVASSDKKNYKIVNKGEFAYNPARINVGSIARLKTYEKGIISPMYIVFKIESNQLDPTFFENFLDSDYFRYEMMKRLEGSVRMILSAESLKNIKITVPSIEEQKKLSNVFSTFDKEIKMTHYQLEKMQKFKKGLLQQMFV